MQHNYQFPYPCSLDLPQPNLGRNQSAGGDKNLQPFPRLPSFLPAAIILSFYGTRDSVKELLMRLNHRSRAYFKKHKTNIAAFAPFTKLSESEKFFGL